MAFKSVFALSTSTPYRWIGPGSDHFYSTNLDHTLSKMLYKKWSVRNSWRSSMSNASPRPDQEDFQAINNHENFSISDMSYSSDGKVLFTGSADKNIYIFDPNTGKEISQIKQAHSCNSAVVSTCYIKDYQFVSGSEASTIALWDLRKSSEAVNVLCGHRSCIRDLIYNESSGGMLLSVSLDNTVRYWNMSAFQSQSDSLIADNADNEDYRGVLANCPNLSHVSLAPNGQWMTVVNSQGTIFVVYNLDILELSRTLKTMRFDDGLVMQLAWFSPNCSLIKRNRIRIVPGDDYAPPQKGAVSKVHGTLFHPLHCFLLMRVGVSQKFGFGTTDWTCGVNLRQVQSSFDTTWLTIHSYGSEVLDDVLVYLREEEKSDLTDKKFSFSSCGQMFSSIGKSHISLSAFSNNFDDPYAVMKSKKSKTFSDLFMNWDSFGAWNSLTEIARINTDVSVSCAKFSPTDVMLAIGDKIGQISFYQPSL